MPNLPFDLATTTYSPAIAYALARISQISYGPVAKIKADCAALGFNATCFGACDVPEPAPFVAVNDSAIIACFRGTADFQDIVSDIRIHLTGGPLAGKVHDGFLHDLSGFWLDVLQAILDQQSAARSLWFTGHSLGAALSTLAVARCLERGLPVNGLYDYGSPRCGDATFATAFDAKFGQAYRFVYNQDVVTRAPPRLLGYQHVGQVKYIENDCQISTGMLGGWAEYLREVDYTLEELRQQQIAAIADHRIENYIECLARQSGVAIAPQSPA